MAKKDLVPIRTTEEAKKRGRNGGIKSGEARRQKKNMRDMAKALMETEVSPQMTAARESLARVGVNKNDMTYTAAIVVRLIQRAIMDGDTNSIRLLGELTGELNRFGYAEIEEQELLEMKYPALLIPENGRDAPKENVLGPQAGPQTMFMASEADIIVYGGAAGGGKTYALLLEALRHKDVNGFGAVVFRKNYTQITAEGGLWDTSHKIFSQVPNAIPKKTPKEHWEFGGGAKLSFAYLERDEDLRRWQGTQIAYIGFDELTHFTKYQFLHMLSRNRSDCGVAPYVRATCNPDADSWVAEFISWWINQDTGYPIPERSGMIRWMVNIDNNITWHEDREAALQYALDCGIDEKEAKEMPKSVTFIASKLDDNKILMEKNPQYRANLLALPEVDKERLLYGNWKIKSQAGRYFKRTQITFVEKAPADIVMWCRAWDLAATDENEKGDADYTAGVLMGKRKDGTIVVLDVINQRIKAGEVEKLVYNTAVMDGKKYGYQYVIRMPQDPGQAGKVLAQQYVKLLSGYNIKIQPVSGSKELRATPFAAQWQNGNVEILIGEWNDVYLNQMESFPESKHDDMVDASSDAFAELAGNEFNIDALL